MSLVTDSWNAENLHVSLKTYGGKHAYYSIHCAALSCHSVLQPAIVFVRLQASELAAAPVPRGCTKILGLEAQGVDTNCASCPAA